MREWEQKNPNWAENQEKTAEYIRLMKESTTNLLEKDQKSIVIDELAGVWIAFIPVSEIVMMQDFLTYSVLAFLLFRVFDIWKPYPISFIDIKIKNHIGIVLDDLVAGLYAAIIVWLILILS